MQTEKSESFVAQDDPKRSLILLLDYMLSEDYKVNEGIFQNLEKKQDLQDRIDIGDDMIRSRYRETQENRQKWMSNQFFSENPSNDINGLMQQQFNNENELIGELQNKNANTTDDIAFVCVANLLSNLYHNDEQTLIKDSVDKNALENIPEMNKLILLRLLKFCQKVMDAHPDNLEDTKTMLGYLFGPFACKKTNGSNIPPNIFIQWLNNKQPIEKSFVDHKVGKLVQREALIKRMRAEITRKQDWPHTESEKMKTLPNGKKVPPEIYNIYMQSDEVLDAIETANKNKYGIIDKKNDRLDIKKYDLFSNSFKEFENAFAQLDKMVSSAVKHRSLLYRIIQKIDVARLFTVSAESDKKFKALNTLFQQSSPQASDPDNDDSPSPSSS